MDVFEQSKLENDAYDHWKSFVHEITYKNRFFPQHPIVELFQSYTENHFFTLPKGTILYRARIIDYDSPSAESTGIVKGSICHQEYGAFEGFDEMNSFTPPPESASSGRANPEKVVYLYTASEIVTAIAETRPRLLDHISVAKIELQCDLRIVDLRVESSSLKIDYSSLIVRNLIASFSHPCKGPIEYIPTQFIAEYTKSLGFDGIAYHSSFIFGGTNITLFHPSQAKAVAFSPYRLDNVVYRARRIAPIRKLDEFDIIATNANMHR